MRRIVVVFVVVMLCRAAHAQQAPTFVGVVQHEPLFHQLQAPHAAVVTEKSDYEFVFAVVGSAPGAGGAFFHSEVTIANRLNRPQSFVAFYFPLGNNTCSTTGYLYSIASNTWFVWSDFLPQFFGFSGLGSVVILATDSTGNSIDFSASMDGFSRIWTPVPGFAGTSSQSFPAQALSTEPDGVAYGLRQDANYRTNIFLFNYNASISTTRNFTIAVNGLNNATTFNMPVNPCSLSYGSLSGNFGNLSMAFVPQDRQGGWFGFGSTIDNLSSDAWSVPARPK